MTTPRGSGSREEKIDTFARWCDGHITGDEKGQAQIFLDRLFQAFGQKGTLDVGGAPEMRIKKFGEDGGGTSFADYVWKPVVLIEMKKRGVDLRKHYKQAFDYWVRLVPDRPRYVVLCNFDEFHVYDFDKQIDAPLDTVKLAELADRWGPLAFLFPTNEKPRFDNDRTEVTREAADNLARCFNLLTHKHRPGGTIERDLAQRFILQSLVALFAEDIDLLPKYTVAHLLDEAKTPALAYDLIGGLFEAMNTRGNAGGRYKGVKYFNGGLFAEPAKIELNDAEVFQLREAARSNWSKVSPDIFGTLFEHSLGKEDRHAFGAHYTNPLDIMKIVKPTIVDPWTDAIEKAKTGKALIALLERLTSLRVLDPACGSGNFLYVAYREMKRLEMLIRDRLTAEFPAEQPRLVHVNARQFFGLDVNAFAVELAKVSMMIGRKLSIDELHIIDEPPLPLDNLDDNFVCVDALMTPLTVEAVWRGEGPPPPTTISDPPSRRELAGGNMMKTPWPPADVIIGNPPFLGAKRLKPERGADYVNALRKLYKDVPGMADYCVYWIARANEHLPTLTKADPFAGRAGLVGTQNIRNNQSRVGGLDKVAATGTIVEAVDNQPWSGEANVHVSIANWIKTQDVTLVPKMKRLWRELKSRGKVKAKKGTRADKTYELAAEDVPDIGPVLSAVTEASDAFPITANTDPQRVFQGVTPGYSGFVLEISESRQFVDEPSFQKLVRPYMIGRELVSGDGQPGRFIIDADHLDLLGLSGAASIFKHLKANVLPAVEAKVVEEKEKKSDMVKAREDHLNRWWTFWARRKELRLWLARHDRIIAASRTQRFPFVFSFISTSIVPGDKLQLFAFDDDYSFGIVQAAPHCTWYESKATRLKNDADYNYSSASVFDTFPWPQSPTTAQVDAVAAAGREVRRVRGEALKVIDGGLRAVYRTLELPGKHPLKDAHATLDAAVLAAYGFSAKQDLLQQLLDLNHAVAAREKAGEAVTAPGVPVTYGDAAALITDDCIRPRDDVAGP